MNIETKVGIFTVTGLILMAVLSIMFGKFDLFEEDGKSVYFRLKDATGLSQGTPVVYLGIKAGEVSGVAMDNGTILAKVKIYDKFNIPDNVKFSVKQSGFVGERYVELENDPKTQPKAYLLDGYEYNGKQSTSNMDTVMLKLDLVAEEMNTLLKTFNDVLSNDKSKDALQESIKNLKDITESINKIVESNGENLNDVLENAKKMTDAVERMLAKNENNINNSMNNLSELTYSLKELSKSVNVLLKNNDGNINSSLSNIKDITDKVNSTMDEIKNITKDINEGKGTLGLLINDEETKEDVKKVVKGVSSFFGDDNGSGEEDDGFKLYGTIGGEYLFDGKGVNTGRGYAGATLYTNPSNFFMLGVSNIPVINPNASEVDIYGNRIKSSTLAFSLQYSHIFYNIFGLRFGIFENTLGLAADLYPLKNNNLAISLEAYDFNGYKNRLDVYTRALIRWHFYKGFFLQGGVEDVLGNTNRVYMLGAGVRFRPSDLRKLADNSKNKKAAKSATEAPVYNDYKDKKESNKKYSKPEPVKEKEAEPRVEKVKTDTNADKNSNNRYDEYKAYKEKQDYNKKTEKRNDDFFDSLVY